MKYVGSRDLRGDGFVAVIDESNEAKELELGLKHVRHSPTGFAWGYLGSGPAQLAFAILLNHFHDADVASRFYQDFKFSVISNLPMDLPWELTTEQVETALDTIRAKREIREAACRDIT